MKNKLTMIRMEVYVPSQGGTAFEFEHCPMPDEIRGANNVCIFVRKQCNFGTTDIELPEHCPMKLMVNSPVTIRFRRVRVNRIDGEMYDDSEEVFAERRAEFDKAFNSVRTIRQIQQYAKRELKRYQSYVKSCTRSLKREKELEVKRRKEGTDGR